MVRIELDVFGDKQVSRELLRFRDAAADMKPALEEIADDFLDIEERQFSSEGRYGSGGWAPLAPSTLAGKVRRGYDTRILHERLRLRRSLTTRNQDHIRKITSDSMFVGTSVPYAIYHQHGTSHMPRRRPVELPARDRDNWVKILQRHLVGSW